MKISEYNEMMAYLLRPRQKFANGGLVMQNQIRRDANEQSRISPDDLRMVAGLVNNQKINVTEAQITGTQQRVAVHEKRARY